LFVFKGLKAFSFRAFPALADHAREADIQAGFCGDLDSRE
jgi:hypothetical protein